MSPHTLTTGTLIQSGDAMLFLPSRSHTETIEERMPRLREIRVSEDFGFEDRFARMKGVAGALPGMSGTFVVYDDVIVDAAILAEYRPGPELLRAVSENIHVPAEAPSF